MYFYIQGPNKHDTMSLEKLFKRRVVNKVEASKADTAIDSKQFSGVVQNQVESKYSSSPGNAYQVIDQLSNEDKVLFAYQVMSAPVESLTVTMTLNQALKIFQSKRFRHLPVVSSSGKVIGMVSDRDIFQHMAGLQANMQKTSATYHMTDKIDGLMQSPVLTANLKTDIRYIARLFVEQHIGAMPIVSDGVLKGLITRSDILRAVMNHYALELWA